MDYYCFFFTDTATTEIYTLSLHDALPILTGRRVAARWGKAMFVLRFLGGVFLLGLASLTLIQPPTHLDRKSTRLNSSHSQISYAVFCLKKKTKNQYPYHSESLVSLADATR